MMLNRGLARLLLAGAVVLLTAQTCRGPGVTCRSDNLNPTLVARAQTTLSGIGATQGAGGECVGAPGQTYTVDLILDTAPGPIYDPNALVTVSMVNGCEGGGCSTVIRGFYSSNKLKAAVTGPYPNPGYFWGMAQVTFDGPFIPQDLTRWFVNIY